ncbi:hypothetical protein RCL1_005987 [Eukaryota sp. TZLM3-RCL]
MQLFNVLSVVLCVYLLENFSVALTAALALFGIIISVLNMTCFNNVVQHSSPQNQYEDIITWMDRNNTLHEDNYLSLREQLSHSVLQLNESISTLTEDVVALKEDMSIVKEDVVALKEDMSIVKRDITEILSRLPEAKPKPNITLAIEMARGCTSSHLGAFSLCELRLEATKQNTTLEALLFE